MRRFPSIWECNVQKFQAALEGRGFEDSTTVTSEGGTDASGGGGGRADLSRGSSNNVEMAELFRWGKRGIMRNAERKHMSISREEPLLQRALLRQQQRRQRQLQQHLMHQQQQQQKQEQKQEHPPARPVQKVILQDTTGVQALIKHSKYTHYYFADLLRVHHLHRHQQPEQRRRPPGLWNR